jgi:hypothetical protein
MRIEGERPERRTKFGLVQQHVMSFHIKELVNHASATKIKS